MKPIRVHITGCAPRSGTTLMMELFRDCFDIRSFGSHEISIFLRPKPEPALYCSKRPQDILFVRPLVEFDSSLWVVFMMRDPRDVIVSKHKRRPGLYWCHLGVWKRRYEIAKNLWNHPRFVVVRYEDLTQRPDATQDQLEARMPFLRRTRRFSEWGRESGVSEASQLALGGVRPVATGSVGSWKERKGRVVSQLRQYGPLHRELIELAYETSDEWMKSLEGVAPEEARSVYRDTRVLGARLPTDLSSLPRSVRFHGKRWIDTARYLLGLSKRVDLEDS